MELEITNIATTTMGAICNWLYRNQKNKKKNNKTEIKKQNKTQELKKKKI